MTLVIVAMIGCGSSVRSGVQPDKRLIDLSESEKSDFCAYEVSAEMAPRTVDCGGGGMVTLKSEADCVSSFASFSASCEATVAQGESCVEAVGADPCSFGGAACAPIIHCLGG